MKQKTIAIANGKGGVAKTTTTFQVGWMLSKMGYRTLLVDCDSQCNLTTTFDMGDDAVYPENIFKSLSSKTVPTEYMIAENLYLIKAHPELCELDKLLASESFAVMRLPSIIKPLKAEYDFIILDCPPYLDTLMVRGAVFAADYLLVPISGDYSLCGRRDVMSLLTTINNDTRDYFGSAGVPETKLLGYLMTRSYQKQMEWKKTLFDLNNEVNPNEIFFNIITERAHIRKCQSAHLPVFDYKKKIKGREVADKGVNDSIAEFEAVTREIIERIDWLDAGHTYSEGVPDACKERMYTFPEYFEIEEILQKQKEGASNRTVSNHI